MKKISFLLFIWVAIVSSTNCLAESTGFMLKKSCSEAEKFLQSTDNAVLASRSVIECLSEIEGFKNGVMASQIHYNKNKEPNLGSVCFPDKITTIQLNSVLVKWLSMNPDQWHHQNILMMWFAFNEKFPCQGK